ncbi:hypothetical protein [Petropleomorpha daqingensis]|uniref:Uncharacterized protein n=1 Tax=Petropleomorpha daqingensis TaxID=2026353 RepID=A0A853CKN8_9ACTN|nr:hypothetical protein [Petropleomorpha daqingensis]NYJ07936.1 hypothetical protein [Petropleomorpha daqingensis]
MAADIRDDGWLSIGGGFESVPDDQVLKFMDKARAAQGLLRADVDVQAWREVAGLQVLYLVLTHVSGLAELNVSLVSRQGAVQTVAVEYDWLGREVLDGAAGVWQIVGLVALALASVSSEHGIELPVLPIHG